MAAYVEVPVDTGEGSDVIVFEVRPEDLGPGLDLVSAGGRTVARATRALAASLGPIQAFIGAVVDKVGAVEPSPDEVKVELGLAFAGELGFAVVAKGSAEVAMTISATWSRPPQAP